MARMRLACTAALRVFERAEIKDARVLRLIFNRSDYASSTHRELADAGIATPFDKCATTRSRMRHTWQAAGSMVQELGPKSAKLGAFCNHRQRIAILKVSVA